MGFSGDFVSPLERPLRVKEIVVYTSSGCHKCAMLKKWLENKNADFEEKNLEDVDVMADLVMRNAVVLSAPALEVEGTVYTEDQIFDGDGLIDIRLLEILKGM
ncbi:MAG: glutaredoxin family protein [Candidatus Bathyarchaeia archaeon]